MVTIVGRLLQELRVGARSLDSVAQEFRSFAWDTRLSAPFSADLVGSEPYGDFPLPNSFEEVVQAHLKGYLTPAQYRVLADAAGGS